MLLTRRDCLTGLTLAALTSRRVTALKTSNDETFWASVRDRFELVPDRTNLVTVVRGVSPIATRERVARENERLNAFRPGGTPNAEMRAAARRKAAAFIGTTEDEVALVRNTTEGVTTVLSNWPLRRGDEILTSSAEHGPFYDTLAARAARDGVVVRRFHYPTPAASLDAIADVVDAAMSKRTRLVMIGHVVLTGQITPVRAIADRVHARGARLLVDGVLGIGHVPTDVRAMNCDFYAAGFHKWGCGPRATAVFHVRPGLVEQLPPLFGAMDEETDGRQKPLWNAAVMNKYERTGAHPDGHYFALSDSLDFLTDIGVERIRTRLYSLTERWVTRAQRVPGFRMPVRLDPDHCAGLVAWEIEGRPGTVVRKTLTERNILVGGTESYAGFFGIPADRPRSLFIANSGVFTSTGDVDRLAEAIEAA